MKKKILIVVGGLVMIAMMTLMCILEMQWLGLDQKKSSNKSTEEVTVVLNERQKSILKKEGLPTDYSKLDFSQKSAIESIEELLQQLEKKHGDKFEYVEYKPTGMSGPERLVAVDLDREELGAIEITARVKKGRVIYEDDFKEREAEIEYEKELFKFLDKTIPGKEVKCVLYTDVSACDSKEKDVIEGSSSYNTIGLKGISTEQLEELIKKYDKWMAGKDLKYPTVTFFALFDEKKFNKINEDRIGDYIHDKKFIKCIKWYDDLDQRTIDEW